MQEALSGVVEKGPAVLPQEEFMTRLQLDRLAYRVPAEVPGIGPLSRQLGLGVCPTPQHACEDGDMPHILCIRISVPSCQWFGCLDGTSIPQPKPRARFRLTMRADERRVPSRARCLTRGRHASPVLPHRIIRSAGPIPPGLTPLRGGPVSLPCFPAPASSLSGHSTMPPKRLGTLKILDKS